MSVPVSAKVPIIATPVEASYISTALYQIISEITKLPFLNPRRSFKPRRQRGATVAIGDEMVVWWRDGKCPRRCEVKRRNRRISKLAEVFWESVQRVGAA